MSSNEHNKKDDKKDGAREINSKLVHGTPRRRKIIRAKRPPMSKTPSPSVSKTDVLSNKTTAVVTPPPASGNDKHNESISKHLKEVNAKIKYDEHTEYVFMGNETPRGKKMVPEDVVTVRFDSSVTAIKSLVFTQCRKLKKVILNEGLLLIEREAFMNCISLEEIIIPPNATSIGESAWCFAGCSSLEHITIPSTVERIGGYAFSGCLNLKEVSFGARLESIGLSAFAGCRLLKQVVFNDGLKEIGSDAFCNCNNLDEVIVMNEKNIQSIHCNAFRGCILLQKIKLQSLSSRLSTIVQAGNTQVEGKLITLLGFYLGCMDEKIYLNPQTYASGGAVQPDLNLWKQIKDNYLDRIDDMLSFYERKEATIIFELAWWKNKIDNPEEDSPSTREECRNDIPGPAKDAIWQYLPCASSFDDDLEDEATHAVEPDWDDDDATVFSQATIPLEGLEDYFQI